MEDEKNLGETLLQYLNSIGMKAFWAKTCDEASTLFYQDQSFNVVLMDIGLPDGNGLSLAETFRKKRKDFVLLFLSALNDPSTRVEGLEIGAEDFITKPFELKELVLRLQRIIKSHESLLSRPEEIAFGPLKIWFKRFEVQDATGEIIPLTQKECAILELLYQNKNQAINRDEIIDQIWGKDAFPSNRTVDNYIVKLRKWCESDQSGSIKITSIRGIGYKLEVL